jgi:hypothetical protein
MVSREIWINMHVISKLHSKPCYYTYECLKIKKDKGFRFLWTYAGKIFMRRNENSQVIHVTDASILQKIDK